MSGQRVGAYEVVQVLARGGMSVVYLARQPTLGREVALKQLDFESDDPTLAERFVREARLAAALNHPNVVTVYDFFEHGGVPYIAMEYVAGGSLRPRVGALTLPQVFGVLEGMLAGLGHAESLGVAHRDLKPENVLITPRGGVKIADFGIARAYTSLTGHLTSTGVAIGTPAYMAPEQALDEPLGPYTDIYSVGIVAYELLAGRPPFDGAGPAMTVLYCHVHKRPPPLAELAPTVPAPVREWVEWLLAKAPAARPATAAQAWEALEEIAVAELGPYWRRTAAIALDASPPTRVAASTPVTEPRASPPPAPRRRMLWAAVGAAAAAVAAAAVAVTLADPEGAPEAGAAFDFDLDRRQELVLGMPGSAADAGEPAGLVLVHYGPGRDPTVITPADAGLRGPHREEDLFGFSPTSGDFDRDGAADLAIGVPGREVVAVLYGGRAGPLAAEHDTLDAADMDLPAAAGDYGRRVVAADLNGDGYSDLVVGAPGDVTEPGSGVIQLLFGSQAGLRQEGARTIRPPDEAWAGFGSRMRTGDVDGDGNADIVEGAADQPGGTAGHGSYCRGRPNGPTRCRPLGAPGGTTAIAVADVNGDGRGDVVQGDNVDEDGGGGEVRLWLGRRRGPARDPLTITQATARVPGTDEPGDDFGWTLDAGNVDGDRFADMAIGAPGEDDEEGAVTIIRGGRTGWARAGHSAFTRGQAGVPGRPVPGEHFGASVALLRLRGDERLDLVIVAAGANRLSDAVLVVEGGPGMFAPGEVDASRLLRIDDAVAEPDIRRIRIGRGTDQ